MVLLLLLLLLLLILLLLLPLTERHTHLGVNNKRGGDNYIGQFGEGLKLGVGTLVKKGPLCESART
jgi:hypothetical protein